MRTISLSLARGAAVLLGAAVAAPAFGQGARPAAPPPAVKPAVQETEPGAHKMVIYEGPNRTVRYFGGGSSGEQAALLDLERAENDMTYLQNIRGLLRQYVNDERILQPQRLYVQEQLYGTQIAYNQSSLLGAYGFGFPGYGNPYPYVNAYGPYTAGGFGYGYGGGLMGYLGSGSTQVVRSLQFGMGDEGRLKDALAQVIAQQAASPDYAAGVTRNYNTALANVARSDRLAKGLNLPRAEGVPAAGTPDQPGKGKPAAVTLTLKGGDKIEGSSMKEDGDWYVVDTAGKEVRVRKSEVTRIDRVK
jgi:hypothetical protein